jgi:hypothetical protein
MSLPSRRIVMHKLIYQGLGWSKAKSGEITVMEEWISYKWDQTIYSHELWGIEEHVGVLVQGRSI